MEMLVFIFARYISNSSTLSFAVGRSMRICLSNLPGRSKAWKDTDRTYFRCVELALSVYAHSTAVIISSLGLNTQKYYRMFWLCQENKSTEFIIHVSDFWGWLLVNARWPTLSRMSTLLVAPNMMTPSVVLMPSISTNSWFSVWSSSLLFLPL